MFKTILRMSSLAGALAFSLSVFAAPQTVTLEVSGMTCSTCPITVKKALTKVDGVQQAKVSYEKREALVTFDDSKTSAGNLSLATANAGFPSAIKAGQ